MHHQISRLTGGSPTRTPSLDFQVTAWLDYVLAGHTFRGRWLDGLPLLESEQAGDRPVTVTMAGLRRVVGPQPSPVLATLVAVLRVYAWDLQRDINALVEARTAEVRSGADWAESTTVGGAR